MSEKDELMNQRIDGMKHQINRILRAVTNNKERAATLIKAKLVSSMPLIPDESVQMLRSKIEKALNEAEERGRLVGLEEAFKEAHKYCERPVGLNSCGHCGFCKIQRDIRSLAEKKK